MQSVMGEMSLEVFVKDEVVKRAVAMSLLNIGELAKKLTREFQQKTPDIPYQKMVAMRNVAAHGYFEIRFDDVWKTVREHIPQLKTKIEGLL